MIRTQTRSAILLSSTAGTDLYESFSIATWGDSLTQGIPGEREPWQDQLADAGLGFRRIYNGGIGGQDSEEIRDRMLAGTDKHNWSTVIWSGRNDKSNFGSWGQRTLDAIAEMTDALDDAGNTRYLVLGVTNNGVEYPALNASLATRYGSRFLDIRAWLVANGLAAVGITPTSGDLTDMSRGVPPTSLRVDATNVHYNTDGNHAIAIALVPLLEAMHSGADYAVAYQALVSGTGAGFAADSLTTNTLYLGQDSDIRFRAGRSG